MPKSMREIVSVEMQKAIYPIDCRRGWSWNCGTDLWSVFPNRAVRFGTCAKLKREYTN